jgi:hypothetical protein
VAAALAVRGVRADVRVVPATLVVGLVVLVTGTGASEG